MEGLFGDCVVAYRLLGVSSSGNPVFEADNPAVLDTIEQTFDEDEQPRTFIGMWCPACGEVVGWDELGIDIRKVPAHGLEDDERDRPTSGTLPTHKACGHVASNRRGKELNHAVRARWGAPVKVLKAEPPPKE